MTAKRAYYLSIVIGILALAACSPRGDQTATSSGDEPITLRLAVADDAGAAGESPVLDFVEQVRTRSDGSIVIEPVWNAAGDNTVNGGFEEGVVAAVKAGEYELGQAGSRVWDLGDVKVFQPLQTPFLIDSDALAVAVATSDKAAQMLDGLAPAGMVGLTLWPEDLRHPFSVVADKPLLSPDDVAGATIRTIPSGVSHALVEALGGDTTFADSGYQGAESGLLAATYSLSGRPIATANVTFFPKYQVLFANGAAFERLSEAQRTILREAAAAARDNAIAGRPSEIDAGVAWCDGGGSIVLVSDAQLAAWVAAVQPVIDLIEADPANAEAVAAIRELKANTPPGLAVPMCDDVAASDDGQTWSTGLPPNGVWTVELSADDMIGMGVLGARATETAGIYTLTLNDGAGLWSFDIGAGAGECAGDYSVVDDVTRWIMTSGPCTATVSDTQWRLEDDGLHFRLVDIQDADFRENRAFLEAKPWQKMEE